MARQLVAFCHECGHWTVFTEYSALDVEQAKRQALKAIPVMPVWECGFCEAMVSPERVGL